LAAVKTTVSSTPRTIARSVSSTRDSVLMLSTPCLL
jgi:hypothetical protein